MKLDFFYYLIEIKFRTFYFLLSFILTFGCCYFFSDTWLFFFSKPFLILDELLEKKLILNKITEGMDIAIRATLFTSFFFITPSFTYNIWAFLVPSLTKYERRHLNTFVFVFWSFFYFCLLLFYSFVFPSFLFFLSGFEIKSSLFELIIEPTFSSYLKLSIFILVIFYFFTYSVFFLLFSLFQGWIKSSHLKIPRKLLLFIIIILSALLAPPDGVTQLNLTLVFYIIYELIFFLGILMDTYKLK